MDGGSAKNHSLTLVKKISQAYCKQLAGSTIRARLNFTPRRAVHGGTSTPQIPRPLAQLSYYESVLDMESYQVLLHLQQV